jgi:hypothetical protein
MFPFHWLYVNFFVKVCYITCNIWLLRSIYIESFAETCLTDIAQKDSLKLKKKKLAKKTSF